MSGALVPLVREARLKVVYGHAFRAVAGAKILGVLASFGLGAVRANRFVHHPSTLPARSPRASIAQEAPQ